MLGPSVATDDACDFAGAGQVPCRAQHQLEFCAVFFLEMLYVQARRRPLRVWVRRCSGVVGGVGSGGPRPLDEPAGEAINISLVRYLRLFPWPLTWSRKPEQRAGRRGEHRR